jgi:hypothetical protein
MYRAPLVIAWLLGTVSATLVALLLAVNGVAVLVLVMTFGLGFPLLFAPTIALYLACLGPAVLLAGRPGWWLGLALSFGAVSAVALLPPRLSEAEAGAEVARATAGDTAAPLGERPRTLEIVRPSDEGSNLDAPFFEGELCGPACRALLLGGEVDWVRVVSLAWARGRQPAQEVGRVRLMRATGAGCATADSVADLDAACVIFVPDVAEPAGLVLRFEDGSRGVDEPYPGAGWATPMGWRRVTATLPGASTPALRRTEVRLAVVTRPALLGAAVRGMSSRGLELYRTTRAHGAVGFAGVLRELGYPLTRLDGEVARAEKRPHGLAGPPDDEATARLTSILDLPGDAPFSPEQQKMVALWLAAARGWSKEGGWAPPRVELVRRITADARVRNAWPLDQIVERAPAVAAAVLPDVIARTEALGLPRDAPWTAAWYGFTRVDPAVLHPHGARIAALIDAHPDPLVLFAGRLAVDPTPWLVPLVRGDARDGLRDRLRAACVAEARWSAQLLPPLRLFLAQVDLDAPSGDDLAEAAARALVRHGDVDGARAGLEGRGDVADRVWRKVEGDVRRVGAKDAICR